MLASSCKNVHFRPTLRRRYAFDASSVARVARRCRRTLAGRIVYRKQRVKCGRAWVARVLAHHIYEGLRGNALSNSILSIHEITLATHARDIVNHCNNKPIEVARVVPDARPMLATLAGGRLIVLHGLQGWQPASGHHLVAVTSRRGHCRPLVKGPFPNPSKRTGRKLPALRQCPTVQVVHGMHACTRAARNVFPRFLQSYRWR